MRILVLVSLVAACRGTTEPTAAPAGTRAAPPSPPAPAAAMPAADARRELTALCDAAVARLPGWAAPIPSTPDGSWPPIPPTALAKRRLTGRCNDAPPAVQAALRARVVPPSQPNTRDPDAFDVCTGDKRYLAFTTYREDASAPLDFADSRTAPTTMMDAVVMVAGKPAGKPVSLGQERPGPFADFDGDGAPELATWYTKRSTTQHTSYTITVWFDHGARPVRWDHTVATRPSELSFVTAGGHPAALFSPTGLDGDWAAPSDLEVFALTRAGGTAMPDAPRELWQLGEADRRLRWGQSACVDPSAEPPALAGAPAVWWERHLVALGAPPERARQLAAALATPGKPEPPLAPPGPDAYDTLVAAIRSRRAATCASPAAAVREAFQREHDAALAALAEARGAELDPQIAYHWGCTTHGETLVAVEYQPPSVLSQVGIRGSEIWSIRADGPPQRRFAALDPRPHPGASAYDPSYFLKIAGYGDFDGDGQLEALLQIGHELDRSHRYFDGYAIWDGTSATELEFVGRNANGVVVDPLLLEIVDGATPSAPSLIVRFDGFADDCVAGTDPSQCDWTRHPPPVSRFVHGALVPATRSELAGFVTATATALAFFMSHRN